MELPLWGILLDSGGNNDFFPTDETPVFIGLDYLNKNMIHFL